MDRNIPFYIPALRNMFVRSNIFKHNFCKLLGGIAPCPLVSTGMCFVIFMKTVKKIIFCSLMQVFIWMTKNGFDFHVLIVFGVIEENKRSSEICYISIFNISRRRIAIYMSIHIIPN